MSMIPDQDGGVKVVSMSDIIRHPLFSELSDTILKVPYTGKGGKEKVREISGMDVMLWTMGLNIFTSYESEVITHRSELTNDVVKCERFVGRKRQDKAWKALEYELIKQRDLLA